MQICRPCRYLNENTCNKRMVDGGREKKRGEGREGELVERPLSPAQTGKVLAVCSSVKYVEGPHVIFSPRRWPSNTSPFAVCRQQLISGPGRSKAREDGKKSDPYGGTIKLTADLQASWKPGQGFITSHDWQPRFTPARRALNISLSPQ